MKGYAAGLAVIVAMVSIAAGSASAQTHEPYFQSLTQLQTEMRQGKLTAVDLTRDYIQRIKALD
ncbi:MAG: amidase, partial [Gammaproteobacteria bacterium]